MFGAACTKGVPDPKKGTRERKKKGGDERGRKGTRRISVRNRNILLLPRTPTIEAKYARTVTDKLVVAMKNHRKPTPKTILLPFSSSKRIKGERSKGPVCPPIVHSNRPAATSSIAPNPPPHFSPLSGRPIFHLFPSRFSSQPCSSLAGKGKKSSRLRFGDRSGNESLDIGINERDKDG